jgi:hypothetical protein
MKTYNVRSCRPSWLLKAGSDPEITFLNVTDALWIVYQRSKIVSQTRQWLTQLTYTLMQREDIAICDVIQLARTFYVLSLPGSQEQKEAIKRLMELAKRRDIAWIDTVEAAFALCVETPLESEERQWGLEMLLTQARWSDITIAQAHETAMARCYASRLRSNELKPGIHMLVELMQRPDLTFEDALILDDNRTSYGNIKALVKQQLTAKRRMWQTIAQRSDLTAEQHILVDQALKDYYHFEKIS